ncbi:transcription initiation factor TFIID subunit 11-like [Phragmites australis]|uniref:transcription initiation factor TFIID subunit 11-like n=1 Tax=Phragmites australis TaxID=29695 RepID=UPI002D79E825|nr:transcription initiation factor TFIID subunit 11-like [Phragmites australis]
MALFQELCNSRSSNMASFIAPGRGSTAPASRVQTPSSRAVSAYLPRPPPPPLPASPSAGREPRDPSRASTFEVAVEEQDSTPESPAPPEEDAYDYDGGGPRAVPRQRPLSVAAAPASLPGAAARAKGPVQKEQDDDGEEHMEVDLEKLPSSTGDPDKLAKMNAILSQFTEE